MSYNKRIPRQSRVQDCSSILDENFPRNPEQNDALNHHFQPPPRIISQSRIPVRDRPNRRSRLPGKNNHPGRHLERSISREEIKFHDDEDQRLRGGPRLRVDVLPIAGFYPHSRSVSTSDTSTIMTPTQSMIAMNGIDNGYAYHQSHTPDNYSISDSYPSLPDLPAANQAFVPKLSTILSPSHSNAPSMKFQASDSTDQTDQSFIEIRDDQLRIFSDQLSETEIEEVINAEPIPQKSNIQLLKVSEYRRDPAGHFELGTLHETATSYEPTCSTTSEDLPPLPAETDSEDFNLDTSSLQVLDSYGSRQYDSDSEIPLPDPPNFSPSPQLRSMPLPRRQPGPDPILLSSANIERPEIKRRPQLSLLRANIEPPLIEKRMPHTPEPLLVGVPRFFPDARQQSSQAEPGSLPRGPRAPDLGREPSNDTPEPDFVLSYVPQSWPKQHYRSEGVVENYPREGYLSPAASDHKMYSADRRSSGGMSPMSQHSQSSLSKSSRRTSSAQEGCEVTDNPDIVLGSPHFPGFRGTFFLFIENAWRPLFGVVVNGALELRVVEQGNRLFSTLPLHVVQTIKLETARDNFYPFSLCINPRYSASFIQDNMHIESPRGEIGAMSHKQQILRFSAGSSPLREEWMSEIRKYISINAEAEEDDEIPGEGIQPFWPAGMIQIMETCFSQFQNSVEIEDFVHIIEVCHLPVDARELFRALDVQDKGFILWRKVKKTLSGISETARLGLKMELAIFVEKSKKQKLYKKHKTKALVLRGLSPLIRDSEDWLSKIEDAFGDIGADYFPLSKDVVDDNVELVFKESLTGETFFRDITDRIKRILIDCEQQNPRSIRVEYLTLDEFVKNYATNKQHFEGEYFE